MAAKNKRCPPGHVWVPWAGKCVRRKRSLRASADRLQRILGIARDVRARYGMLAEEIKEARRGES